MPAGKNKSPSRDLWLPLSLQLIAFPDVPPLEIKQAWFNDLVGEKPQEIFDNRINKIYSGPFQDCMLKISLEPLKVTVAVQPNIVADAENQKTDFVPTLGPFTPACDKFYRVAQKWLNGSHPPIKRLAFAGKVIQKTKNHSSAYRLISRYLPAVKVDPKSGDLFYRINRRRKSASGIKGLEINRLTTWTSATYSLGASQSGSGDTPVKIMPDNFVCMFDFDINTIGEYKGILPDKKLTRLFKELIGLASEIAEKGDVK
jgi:hypothetical protein